MTSPVVMMPLNQDLMAANLTVEQLQTFQHVDNVVEVQLQPCPAPPQSTTVVDTSFFERVTNMMNTFDKLVPLLTNLGSDRRSPTAGPSEIVSPNPLARVPDSAPQVPVVAPQSPDLAPRPSSASSEPRASTSGLQQRRQDEFASPRGRSDERDRSRGSRHASPSLQHHLRRQIDDVHRQLVNAKEIVDLYHAQSRVPPDQARYDLEVLQDRYTQLHIALEESLASSSFHSHGPSPSPHGIASPGVAHLAPMRGSPGLDRRRSPYRFSSRSDERYEQRVASSDAPAHSRRPRSRSHTLLGYWTSPASPLRLTIHRCRDDPPLGGHRHLGRPSRLKGASPHGGPLRLLRGASPHREPLRLPRGASPPRGHLLLSVWQAIQAQDLALPRDPFLGVLSFLDAPPGNPSLQREVPLHQKDDVMRRETQSPLHLSTHLELLRESPRRRDPTHGLLLVQLLLPERRRKLMKLPFQPRSRPWWSLLRLIFLMPSPPRPISLLDLSASVGVTDPATPSGSLLAWSQVMSDSFLDTQKKFSQRIQEGRACHTLLPSLHRLEKVSNSPTQGKELTANPDVLDLLKNKVQDFRQLPISIKEGVALERTLRSMMESHSFLTWSVMGLLKSLHQKNLLPKDDPVITQLQKSFSKACSSLASSMTSSAAFVTMKRRQLLLSHVVPSVSEAQKRNLLSDPFFQTTSLFDASSVESARSAARDLSLFKPHLKASASSPQSRRQGPSNSLGRRGSARQYSGPSSSQRASSPFRQQSGKKGDARFHKKSSGTPQKRGGFRK